MIYPSTHIGQLTMPAVGQISHSLTGNLPGTRGARHWKNEISDSKEMIYIFNFVDKPALRGACAACIAGLIRRCRMLAQAFTLCWQ
jgi:hypothetical protein